MPEIFFADLVREYALGTGTGPMPLDGAVPGHRRFVDAVPPGAQFHYAIAGITHEDEWEVGLGSLNIAAQLLRTPLMSSNGGALVDFAAGSKSVALTVTADWFSAQGDGSYAVADIAGLQTALDDRLLRPIQVKSALANTDVLPVRDMSGGNWDVPVTAIAFKQSTGHFHADNRFGIMTNTPFAPLHAVASGTTPIAHATVAGEVARFESSSSSRAYVTVIGRAAGQSEIWFGDEDNLSAGRLRYLHTNDSLGLWTAGDARIYINSSGAIYPATNGTQLLGSASFRWSTVYAATGTINTSDEREKCEIGPIPDTWLDAWGSINWSRYRFRGRTRWHTGLVAQRVHAAFAAHGLDAFDIGLCCYDAWEEEREPLLSKCTGEPTRRSRVTRAAGDRWGLRYDECFALEAAWQRRELARIAARLPC